MPEGIIGGFGFGMRRPYEMILKKGDSVIIAEWSWRKFGYVRKFVTLDENGDIKVKKF